MPQDNEFTLKVSESANVRPGHFRASVSVIYAGMLNDSTYSIVVKWTYGYNSLAYNLFLSKDQREVEIPKGRLEILSVTPEKLCFRFCS